MLDDIMSLTDDEFLELINQKDEENNHELSQDELIDKIGQKRKAHNESQRKYYEAHKKEIYERYKDIVKKYNKKNLKSYTFFCHKENDEDIIKHLSGIKGKSKYIKQLILNDIEEDD